MILFLWLAIVTHVLGVNISKHTNQEKKKRGKRLLKCYYNVVLTFNGGKDVIVFEGKTNTKKFNGVVGNFVIKMHGKIVGIACAILYALCSQHIVRSCLSISKENEMC